MGGKEYIDSLRELKLDVHFMGEKKHRKIR